MAFALAAISLGANGFSSCYWRVLALFVNGTLGSGGGGRCGGGDGGGGPPG